MRKAQKQEILEIIENFPEMHREIRTAIERSSLAVAIQLLQDCQEYAVSLCKMLLETEESAAAVTGAFEEYCLALVAVVEKLEGAGAGALTPDATMNDLMEQLNAKCRAIVERIEKEIPIRKEVVFFPYKASMWDSLESIYLAAKEDENCDAYCVPIPYFDKNPDGSFKEMHYEGKEYPANIEVTDWQSYNFEERRPDVIYIHNPYDNCNYVTSVHPRFYAENLKKYTEELVYVPYFVLEEIEPDDQVKIDSMKHFCFVPGTVYADKVILQSEKMAQIYRNEYKKAVESAGGIVDEDQLKEKFLGLGSPKFDKVLNTRKEDLEIPPEWLQIIEKPDGSRKKVIFYNTSVTALLQNDERMLEKMKHVFDVFKENQKEVALLWRPHPLIQSTIESMRPQLWKAYHELVEQYKEEGWGIYDDTPDMDRAVVLSDAYYGDVSSLVQVYQKTGKNVLIQNLGYTRNCACMDFDIHDSLCIFIPRAFPMVIFQDLEDGKICNIPITCYSSKCNLEDEEYGTVAKIDNGVIIAPFHGDKFVVITEKGKEEIELKAICNSDILPFKLKFSQMLRYNHKIYFIGFQIPAIICYDIKKEIFYEVNSYRNVTAELLKDNLIMRVTNNGIHAYMIVWNTKYVIDFNMQTEETNIIFLEEGECPISVCVEKSRIWYGFMDKPYILCYDLISNKTQYIEANLLVDRVFFSFAFETLNRIYFIGNEKNHMERSFALYYDYIEKKFVKCNEIQNMGYIQAARKISDKIIIFMAVNRGKGKTCIWNVKEEYIKNQIIEISMDEQHKIFEWSRDSMNDNTDTALIEADGLIGLSAYVDYINHIDSVCIKNRDSKLRGKIIFNATKKRK